jgi:hypothetical protein
MPHYYLHCLKTSLNTLKPHFGLRVHFQVTSYEILGGRGGTRTSLFPIFFRLPLLAMPPLLLDVCNAADQAARYHILGLHIWGLMSDLELSW